MYHLNYSNKSANTDYILFLLFVYPSVYASNQGFPPRKTHRRVECRTKLGQIRQLATNSRTASVNEKSLGQQITSQSHGSDRDLRGYITWGIIGINQHHPAPTTIELQLNKLSNSKWSVGLSYFPATTKTEWKHKSSSHRNEYEMAAAASVSGTGKIDGNWNKAPLGQ